MNYKFGQYLLKSNNKLYGQGKNLTSDGKLIALLGLLIKNYPNVVDKSEIMNQIWEGRVVTESSLFRAISDLRQLLGEDGKSQQYIKTVHGKGFRFEVEPIPTTENELETQSQTRTYKKIIPWVLLAIALSVLGVIFESHKRNLAHSSNKEIQIAIFPLNIESSHSPEKWLADAANALITEKLENLPNINVISPINLQIYIDNNYTQHQISKLTKNEFAKICKNFSCTHILTMAYKNKKGQKIIDYQLIGKNKIYESNINATDIINAAIQISTTLEDIFFVTENNMPADIIEYSTNTSATRDYAIALIEISSGNMKHAEIYLRMALEKDPDFFAARRKLLIPLAHMERYDTILHEIKYMQKMSLTAEQQSLVSADLANYFYQASYQKNH